MSYATEKGTIAFVTPFPTVLLCARCRLGHRKRIVKRDGLSSPVVRLDEVHRAIREDQPMVNNGRGVGGVYPAVDVVGIYKKERMEKACCPKKETS